ncbi:hypothetical protein ACFFSH_32975 [Streptomyces filamentosus]|uniref:Uncharacterized protein n=1 Tax=Streptomyces filamentosus TaxID=67294 RepID=A0A919EGT9_STRFL|nr:hypothetical protein [Streptomyces filamentosus]GHF77555.1 hypothetical protein GCM10017667_01060 [Streptomyces filamentosus]
MPTPSITISSEFSGSVVARGAADDLSAMLLKHAGFQQTQDCHGRRHRLPTTTPGRRPGRNRQPHRRHAPRRPLRRRPRTLPGQGPNEPPANPLEPYAAGAALLQITDEIRSAENGEGLRRAVDQLLHPEHGALEYIREALEAAGEHINGLDDEAYRLADRFGFAADFVCSAQSELVDSEDDLRRVGGPSRSEAESATRSSNPSASRSAALAVSPAGAKADVATAAFASDVAELRPSARPSHLSGPRR